MFLAVFQKLNIHVAPEDKETFIIIFTKSVFYPHQGNLQSIIPMLLAYLSILYLILVLHKLGELCGMWGSLQTALCSDSHTLSQTSNIKYLLFNFAHSSNIEFKSYCNGANVLSISIRNWHKKHNFIVGCAFKLIARIGKFRSRIKKQKYIL